MNPINIVYLGEGALSLSPQHRYYRTVRSPDVDTNSQGPEVPSRRRQQPNIKFRYFGRDFGVVLSILVIKKIKKPVKLSE